MPELVWIIDPATGDLVVEGLEAKEAVLVVGDLMPPPHELNCARPLATVPLPGQMLCRSGCCASRDFGTHQLLKGPDDEACCRFRGVRCAVALFIDSMEMGELD